MIKTNNLTKIFRTDEVETTALYNVQFNARQGEFVAVMGPSGCGKSTLLNIIGLLDNPSNGQYYFMDKEVSGYKESQRTGGQQQRVAIARAVVTNPRLILADEPTGNLDSANGEEVLKLLEELNHEGTTIVMVTHSPGHAERAHRIVQLFDGHVVTENIKKKI
jgi:ABC-type lipoprotein export system ATPase subunit